MAATSTRTAAALPAATARQTALTCNGHTRPVVDLDFSSAGQADPTSLLLSAAKDGSPMLRDGQTGDWIGTFVGHKGAVWSGRLNSTGTQAVTGSADFTAKLWDTKTGAELSSFPHKHIVRAVHFSEDNGSFATGGYEKQLRLFDLTNYNAAPSVMQTQTIGPILGITAGTDPNLLITHGDERVIRVWDRRTLDQVRIIPVKEAVTSLERSRGGTVLTSAAGSVVAIRDATTLDVLKEFDLGTKVLSASLHPTHDRFVAGGSDCHLHVHDAVSGQELELYKGHHGPVHCVHYSPDGELYASGSEDGTIRLWQTVPGAVYGLWLGPSLADESAASGAADRRPTATASA